MKTVKEPSRSSDGAVSARRVGAVTVNYNAGDDLLACVQSLLDEGVVDIQVIDNGSTDGSYQDCEQRYPNVPVTHLPNPGYGGGMNHGAAAMSNEFVFILNPDARLSPGAIDALVARMDADPRLALLGPRILESDGSEYPSGRRFPSLVDGIGHAALGLFWTRNPFTRRYKMLDWDRRSYREVDWVSGSAMFVRRSAFDQLGGFDPDYWMYLEDVDLCYRLNKAGWKTAYEPAACVVHEQGTSTSKTPQALRFVKVHQDSVLRYQRKHATGIDRFLYPLMVLGLRLRYGLAGCLRWWNGRKSA